MSDDNILNVFVNTAQEWALLSIIALLVAGMLIVAAPIFVIVSVVYAVQGKWSE